MSNLLFYFANNHELLADLATLIASLSIFGAIMKYIWQKRRERLLFISELISFFRKEVLPDFEEFGNKVKAAKGPYDYKLIPLLNPAIKSVKEKYSKEFLEQMNLTNDLDLLPIQTSLLNSLEELSLKIYYGRASGHKALNPIKSTFVQIIESNAYTLLMYREVWAGDSVYNYSLHLYKKWQSQVDRRTPEERFSKIIQK